MARTWVDEDGFFLRGVYEGADIVDITEEDPDYIVTILNKKLDRDERTFIEEMSGISSPKGS